MAHPHASRPRQKPLGNEEAGANLSLGEFTDDYALSNSEARLLINTIVDKQRQISSNYKESEALVRTNDHLDLFARYKSPGTVTQLEGLLKSASNLASFERSQLGSLCCGEAEEAKSLIPSITNKISDDDLTALIEQLEDLRKESERGEML